RFSFIRQGSAGRIVLQGDHHEAVRSHSRDSRTRRSGIARPERRGMAAQHRASAAGAPPGLALAGPVMAADWYVSPSGLDTNACTSTAAPCKTIQAAIDKAAAYDTVHVGAGSYSFEAQRI